MVILTDILTSYSFIWSSTHLGFLTNMKLLLLIQSQLGYYFLRFFKFLDLFPFFNFPARNLSHLILLQSFLLYNYIFNKVFFIQKNFFYSCIFLNFLKSWKSPSYEHILKIPIDHLIIIKFSR